jgi:hypothetical protein
MIAGSATFACGIFPSLRSRLASADARPAIAAIALRLRDDVRRCRFFPPLRPHSRRFSLISGDRSLIGIAYLVSLGKASSASAGTTTTFASSAVSSFPSVSSPSRFDPQNSLLLYHAALAALQPQLTGAIAEDADRLLAEDEGPAAA